MNLTEKELIEEKFKNVYLRIDSNHSEVKLLLEQILNQTLKTNGRVTSLEEQTEYVRLIPKYKKIIGLAILGLFTLFSSFGILGLIKSMI